jgi:hypothetical protein
MVPPVGSVRVSGKAPMFAVYSLVGLLAVVAPAHALPRDVRGDHLIGA